MNAGDIVAGCGARRRVTVGVLLVGVLAIGGCAQRTEDGSAEGRDPARSADATRPVGAPLPSGAECADRVGAGDREEVPDNDRANHTVPGSVTMPVWEDFTERVNAAFVSRIDGRHTGTTGALIEWAACKWGLDPDVLRAVAYQESDWQQGTAGDRSDDQEDCVDGATAPCPTSFSLVQLKTTDLPGSYPDSRTSTAFALDYYGARMRACYEGEVTYLGGGYAPGDLWGCIGWHWSGMWRDAGATNYIGRVQRHLANRSWAEFSS